jgi:Kef-type K+ transport system membrane component KefB
LVKPIFKEFTIPPIIGMIVMGFIARNLIPQVKNAYQSDWAQSCRAVTLVVLLVKSGL